ncbi:MAG: hypothetical protein IPI71_10090 [Methanolinea sp.]|nr:MAG: hypothetical protein IPI71_10090 [Methanolinea sp.]
MLLRNIQENRPSHFSACPSLSPSSFPAAPALPHDIFQDSLDEVTVLGMQGKGETIIRSTPELRSMKSGSRIIPVIENEGENDERPKKVSSEKKAKRVTASAITENIPITVSFSTCPPNPAAR